MKRLSGSVVMLAWLWGCGPSSAEQGYLLLDPEARSAGFSLEVAGWEGAPISPVNARPGERAWLHGVDGRTRLEIRIHQVAHVRGPQGQVHWSALGKEIREDGIDVLGTEAGAQELAHRIDAQIAPTGDGAWRLAAPDIFERVAFLHPPAGVEGIAPQGLEGVRLAPSPWALDAPAGTTGGPAADLGLGATLDGSYGASRVGFYRGPGGVLVLDASGGFTLTQGCGAPARIGRFRETGDGVLLVPEVGSPLRLNALGGTLVGADGPFEALTGDAP